MRTIREQRTPVTVGMLVALVGTVLAALGDWSAVAVYAVGIVATLAYLSAALWAEGR